MSRKLGAVHDYDFNALQIYFLDIADSEVVTPLSSTAGYYANLCDIGSEDYEEALAGFEAIIENPPTTTDSVYAVIDAEYTILKMQGQGRGYSGKYNWLKVDDLDEFRSSKKELLSCLMNNEPLPTQDAPDVTEVLSLSQNYPNPFNPVTTIAFSLPAQANVELAIYNVKGQKISTLVNETLDKGSHKIEWNGVDDYQKPVASGVYLYRLETGGKKITKKCLLLK